MLIAPFEISKIKHKDFPQKVFSHVVSSKFIFQLYVELHQTFVAPFLYKIPHKKSSLSLSHLKCYSNISPLQIFPLPTSNLA